MNPLKDTMSVLAQIVKYLPAKAIDVLAKKYKIQTRAFSATSHVITMLYAHLSHALSLNDLCDSLQNHQSTLSQIRNCTPPSRNGLSYANRTRNADLAESTFWVVFEELKADYPEFFQSSRRYPGLPYRFQRRVYAFDSTTIQLTVASISWAKHRCRKAAIKSHTGLNLQSSLPEIIIVKSAKGADAKEARALCAFLRATEVALFDKAYVDFEHLNDLDERNVFWVTRAKDNMQYQVVGEHTEAISGEAGSDEQEVMGQQLEAISGEAGSDEQEVMGQQVDVPQALARRVRRKLKKARRKYQRKKIRVLSDLRILLTGVNTSKYYPQELRLVIAEVEVKKKMTVMTFITNNFTWSPYTVCELYQARWGIEVFFKEIKQNLQLADFMGYNENAIRWQFWTAMLTYLLLRFIAWENKWKHSFSRLFTLIRGIIWNYFQLGSVLECCDSMGRRGPVKARGSPEHAYQMLFDLT